MSEGCERVKILRGGGGVVGKRYRTCYEGSNKTFACEYEAEPVQS